MIRYPALARLAVLTFLLALLPFSAARAATPKTLILDWRQVIPVGSGDPNMFGDATIDVNAGQARLCYSLHVLLINGIDWPPTGASIHNAPAGSNGPLVVDLQPNFAASVFPAACLNIGSALAHDIQRDPDRYYLLINDITHPDGAARAQLRR